MSPLVLAAFPGLLFSVQPPARPHAEKPAPVPLVREHKVQPIDSCNTYIYVPTGNTFYYNGQPISPELMNKLGPLAAPLRQSLSQENVG